MKKLRNLDQLSPEKRAALEAMLSSPEEVITPMQAQPILEADPNTLEAVIEEGVFTQTIGELLEQARTSRGVGVRELARRLQVNHSQIKQLEGSGRGRLDNMEVQSLTRQAKALSYRVRIVLEPEEGGIPLEVRLG
jgi:ribosome-binding protein aMBF1 (putative translation factor)